MLKLFFICVELLVNDLKNIYVSFKIGLFIEIYVLMIVNNLCCVLLIELVGIVIVVIKI